MQDTQPQNADNRVPHLVGDDPGSSSRRLIPAEARSSATDAEPLVMVVGGDAGFGEFLAATGWRVHRVTDGAVALGAIGHVEPDVVLVGETLGDMCGLDLCRVLHRQHRLPIVMFAASRAGWRPEIGLDLGADDYVAWPERTYELVARLRAVLRRTGTHRRVPTVVGMVEVDDLVLDPEGCEVRVDGRRVQLTPVEYQVLELLVAHSEQPVAKARLGERAWGPGHSGGSRRVEWAVNRLRRKLEVVPAGYGRIATVRGIGYAYRRQPDLRSWQIDSMSTEP